MVQEEFYVKQSKDQKTKKMSKDGIILNRSIEFKGTTDDDISIKVEISGSKQNLDSKLSQFPLQTGNDFKIILSSNVIQTLTNTLINTTKQTKKTKKSTTNKKEEEENEEETKQNTKLIDDLDDLDLDILDMKKEENSEDNNESEEDIELTEEEENEIEGIKELEKKNKPSLHVIKK